MLTLTAQTTAVAPSDSIRLKAKAQAQAALRRREFAEQQTLSSSDSAFFFPSDTTFEQVCHRTTDISSILSQSRYADRAVTISRAQPSDNVEAVTIQPIDPTPRGTTALRPYADIIVGLILGVVVILGIISHVTGSFMSDIIGFFNNSNGWRRLCKATQHGTNAAFVLLDGVFVIALTTLALEVAIVAHPFDFSVLETAGLLAVSICLFYALRMVTDRIIGYAFMTESRMRSIAMDRHASRAVIGIVLTPLALAMPFVSTFACGMMARLAIFVVLVITGWRIVKSVQINSTSLPSILYFILYLCIVEIAPVICIARVVGLISGVAEWSE